MITKFLARFKLGRNWPHWRIMVWLALVSEFVGLFAALETLGHRDSPGEWSYLAFTAGFGMVVGVIIAYFLSPTKFRKWHRRQWEEGLTRTDRGRDWALVGAFLILTWFVAFFTGWGLDRMGVIHSDYYHPESVLEQMFPKLCVNDAPVLGSTLPLPEKMTVSFWVLTEIRSVQICPHPYEYRPSLKIDGLRFQGRYFAGVMRLDFDPPLKLKVGEEIEVGVTVRAPEISEGAVTLLYLIEYR